MKILVDLDPRDVWRIQSQAERAGTSPGAVLRDELAVRRNAASIRERVRQMVTAGECDADIAAALSYAPGRIATIRRGLGLPANPRYRRRDSA